MKNPAAGDRPLPALTPARGALGLIVAGLLATAVLIHVVRSLHPPNWYIFGPDRFYTLMGFYEPGAFAIIAGAILIFLPLHFFTLRRAPVALELKWPHVIVFALATFGFCYYGADALQLRFPLALDEYAAVFQAQLYASGHSVATIPPDLLWLKQAIVPQTLVIWGGNRVIEVYLPVHSLLLAAGILVFGTPWIVDPLLAAGSLLLIFAVARNLRLDPSLPGWSVVLLATSTQFLLMSVSGWAMPSHLFFNLAWLYFYTHADKRLYYLCPPIGVLAIGLHQPICHVLFVLPFLLRLLLDRRWTAAGYSAVIYLVGGLFWVHWILTIRPDTNGDIHKDMGMPDLRSAFIFYLSLLLLLSWQNLLTAMAVVGAFFQVRQMPPFFRDLALSFTLTAAFYLLFSLSQTDGWGYRYIYPALGNLILIAAWVASRARITTLTFAAMTILALGVQLPYRCLEVRQVEAPTARAYATLSHLDADFVIVDTRHGWFSIELMRNNPDFKNRPIMALREKLSDQQMSQLLSHYKTVIISQPEFRKFGIPPIH